jgi:hypothetical protein
MIASMCAHEMECVWNYAILKNLRKKLHDSPGSASCINRCSYCAGLGNTSDVIAAMQRLQAECILP